MGNANEQASDNNDIRFTDFDLDGRVARAVADLGYESPPHSGPNDPASPRRSRRHWVGSDGNG